MAPEFERDLLAKLAQLDLDANAATAAVRDNNETECLDSQDVLLTTEPDDSQPFIFHEKLDDVEISSDLLGCKDSKNIAEDDEMPRYHHSENSSSKENEIETVTGNIADLEIADSKITLNESSKPLSTLVKPDEKRSDKISEETNRDVVSSEETLDVESTSPEAEAGTSGLDVREKTNSRQEENPHSPSPPAACFTSPEGEDVEQVSTPAACSTLPEDEDLEQVSTPTACSTSPKDEDMEQVTTPAACSTSPEDEDMEHVTTSACAASPEGEVIEQVMTPAACSTPPEGEVVEQVITPVTCSTKHEGDDVEQVTTSL